MAPNPWAREQVRKYLEKRSSLSRGEWYSAFWESKDVPREVSDFVYDRFKYYSKTDFSRVVPSDLLFDDLQFWKTCFHTDDTAIAEDASAAGLLPLHFGLPWMRDVHTVEELVLSLAKEYAKHKGAT